MPVGSCEQHGPHLPLDTDTRVAEAVALRAAVELGDAVVAPAIGIGASGEHAGFAGTLSIGTEVLTAVLVELGRSADAFEGVVLVNGHGGNAAAVAAAVDRLVYEGRRALAWHAHVPGGDAHAGRDGDLAAARTGARAGAAGRGRGGCDGAGARAAAGAASGGVGAVSPNGVLGDPAGASAAEGAALLDGLVADLVAAVRSW